MNDNAIMGKECIFSYDEMYIIHGLLREVFLGFKLDENEKKIIGDLERGRSLQKLVSKVFREEGSEYNIVLTIDDIIVIRNSFIVVAVELNHYNIYSTHMGRELEECLVLLRRLDEEMLHWPTE